MPRLIAEVVYNVVLWLNSSHTKMVNTWHSALGL